MECTAAHYQNLRYPEPGQIRGLISLRDLGAINIGDSSIGIKANLDRLRQISETSLRRTLDNLHSAVLADHPAMAALSQLFGRRWCGRSEPAG